MTQTEKTHTECLGVDSESVCMDCQRKSTQVAGADTFIVPPVSIETGQCAQYQMGENAADKRMNAVGSNGGFINFNFLMALLVLFALAVVAGMFGGVVGGVMVR